MNRNYDDLLKNNLPKILFIGRLALICALLSGFGIVGKAVTLWHNADTTTILNSNTQTCINGGTNHWDNSFWRSFTPANFGHTGTFTITGVRIGIDFARAGGVATSQPMNVRIYTNTGGAFPAGTRTQIASLATTVPNGSMFFQDIAIAPPAQPATTEIVVEVHTPSGSPAQGTLLRIGSNSAGQTAPSYRASGTCGPGTPTDMATLGGSFTHLLFGLVGLGPVAAEASVSGRVATADGRGIRNARVSMTLPNGEIRTVHSGTFGYYNFDEIEVGQTVVVSVNSKQFQFAPQILTVNDNLTDIDFIAQ